jgi:alkanesulfonate monooxygenase SsuD/methylene tetrahydromethanopterin reductase-like flavin-dependent oxidoreductase (luciferase family)
VKLGFYTSAIGWSYPDLRSVWLAAEAAGFVSAHIMDNVVRPLPTAPDEPVFEAYVALTALAEATSTMRLGPLVVGVIRRSSRR